MINFKTSIAATIALLTACAPAVSGAWPPSDPNQIKTSVKFTEVWARKLKGFRTLADLQRIAGAKGSVRATQREDGGDHPYVTYDWEANGTGTLMATVYKDGWIFVYITTDHSIELTASNTGSFHCEDCLPPIEIQMQEPSWLNGWGSTPPDIYKAMAVRDFILDGEKLAVSGDLIAFHGVYVKYGNASYLFQDHQSASALDTNKAIQLLTSDASRDFRSQVLECGAGGCDVMVKGHATTCEHAISWLSD